MENIEQKLLELIAVDRIDRPISSMSGKLYRKRPKLAKAITLEDGQFEGDRTFAYTRTENQMSARGMKQGIEAFSEKHPKYGAILKDTIAGERAKRETHLYFGMHPGKRLTTGDYLGVMTDLGFSEKIAHGLYGELMDVSHRLARKRDEGDRKVLIG